MDSRQALISTLAAHRQALMSAIGELQRSIAEDTRRLADLQMKLESVLSLMRMEAIESADEPAGRHFLEEAYDLLLESGALHYTRLAEVLRERQVFIPGIRPEMNLLAHINRDRRFERVGRGTYQAVVQQPDEPKRTTRRSTGRRAA